MYHTFFYGPFPNEAAVVAALQTLDKADPMWDYDCFAIHYGDPDTKDYVHGFRFVTHEQRERIEQARRPDAKLEQQRILESMRRGEIPDILPGGRLATAPASTRKPEDPETHS